MKPLLPFVTPLYAPPLACQEKGVQHKSVVGEKRVPASPQCGIPSPRFSPASPRCMSAPLSCRTPQENAQIDRKPIVLQYGICPKQSRRGEADMNNNEQRTIPCAWSHLSTPYPRRLRDSRTSGSPPPCPAPWPPRTRPPCSPPTASSATWIPGCCKANTPCSTSPACCAAHSNRNFPADRDVFLKIGFVIFRISPPARRQ